jgi:serine phosphatase RsbU (regulator of sigma subunit)
MNRNSIFQQLLVKIILPVVVVLLGLAFYNISESDEYVSDHFDVVNKIYSDEIQTFLEFQDHSLKIIEENLDEAIKTYSYKLINEEFIETSNIENLDLDEIRNKMHIDPSDIDIYIIDKRGFIVNTTFTTDLGKNVFDFGKETKRLVERVFTNKSFEGGEFSPESETNILRKYTYHSTLDGKYIIELGVKSSQANEVIKMVQFKLNHLTQRANTAIQQVDLFIGGLDNPVSFNNKGARVILSHMNVFETVLRNSKDVTIDNASMQGYVNTQDTLVVENGKRLHFQYTFMPRESNIYHNSVIRIISDRSKIVEFRQKNVILYGVVIVLLILILMAVLFIVSTSITKPLARLVKSLNSVADGSLNERSDTSGSKEVLQLVGGFNQMTENLRRYFYDLEKTVKEDKVLATDHIGEIQIQKDQIRTQREDLLKANKGVKASYRKIEEQNKLISDSIHYAHRVENILLPTRNHLVEALRDYFILYKPRNVVGGDFYWAVEVNGKSVVACADCTGHGVPGAFMSIIGITMLNKIVKEQHVLDPSDILEKLRVGVIGALLSTEEHIVRDGIDISIAVIDHNAKHIEYVGANSPIVLVQDEEIKFFKGSKQSLGSSSDDLKPFKKELIKYNPGDAMYLFTDGYQDQFGGDQDKKFMVKRLRNLFLRVHELPVAEQKDIINSTIEDWMMNSKQVDDMLIIGVKL